MSATLGEQQYLAKTDFVKRKTLAIQWRSIKEVSLSVKQTAKISDRQRAVNSRLDLTTVNYVECPERTLGKVMSLLSVTHKHSAK
jgi:hypothetical protein